MTRYEPTTLTCRFAPWPELFAVTVMTRLFGSPAVLSSAWATPLSSVTEFSTVRAPESVLKVIAGFQVHRGVLGVGHRPPDERLAVDRVLPRRGGPLTVTDANLMVGKLQPSFFLMLQKVSKP